MKMNEFFLGQLERQAAPTRRALERVPEGRNDWRPHPKSMPMGYLAALVASMPATDEHLLRPWRMLVTGRVVSEQIRHVAISDSVFSHWAHHRGQLTVYLRLNDVAVPAIYGPSADEGTFSG
jgi:hypothetical protein